MRQVHSVVSRLRIGHAILAILAGTLRDVRLGWWRLGYASTDSDSDSDLDNAGAK